VPHVLRVSNSVGLVRVRESVRCCHERVMVRGQVLVTEHVELATVCEALATVHAELATVHAELATGRAGAQVMTDDCCVAMNC